MFLLEFFRDVLDGPLYLLYVLLCIFLIFYVLGIVGDRKRVMIEKKLKEKKQYDISSGKEAAIAAMETKQVLSVDDAPEVGLGTQVQNGQLQNGQNGQQQEEVPAVMVLDSSSMSQPQQLNTQLQMGQPQPLQPLVQQQVQPLSQQPLMQQVAQSMQPLAPQPVQPLVQPLVQQPATVAQQPVAAQPLIINTSGIKK